MNFRFLYDPQRRIFSIGYRLADAEGPGRLDPSYYDLLASEARLASFIAIAKGDVPETHWFHLGRLVTSVRGTPTLLSWSATMFEYLMPLLVMQELSGHAARRVLPDGGAAADRVRARTAACLGHLGVRLQRRRPPRHLPVQGLRRPRPRPEARPRRRAGGRALRDGARGHGRSRGRRSGTCAAWPPPASRARTASTRPSTTRTGATDDAAARPKPAAAGGTVVRAYLAHHQGMTLVALANALLGDRMVKRFHADPRVQATELLLQERVPRHAPITQPRPVEETRVAGPAPAQAHPALPDRRTPRFPHAQFLSNGNYTAVVTNAGGGASFCRGRAVTRHREDADPRPGQPVPLPARRAQRRGLVGRPSIPTRHGAARTTW